MFLRGSAIQVLSILVQSWFWNLEVGVEMNLKSSLDSSYGDLVKGGSFLICQKKKKSVKTCGNWNLKLNGLMLKDEYFYSLGW